MNCRISTAAALAIITLFSLQLSGCGLKELQDRCCCVNNSTKKNYWTTEDKCTDVNAFCATSGAEGFCGKPPTSQDTLRVRRNPLLASMLQSYTDATFIRVADTGAVKGAPPADPTECEAQCAPGGTFCMRVAVPVADNMSTKVSKARDLLADPNRDKVGHNELMSLFDQRQDSCNRDDTKLSGGLISNSGATNCSLTSDVSRGATKIKVTIGLPPQVTAVRTLNAQNMVLIFSDPTSSPTLSISDADFDQEYGGVIQRVAAAKSSAVVSTSRGCIALKIGNAH